VPEATDESAGEVGLASAELSTEAVITARSNIAAPPAADIAPTVRRVSMGMSWGFSRHLLGMTHEKRWKTYGFRE
jgi:hypothetical protein